MVLPSQGLGETLHGCVLCVVRSLVLCRRRVLEVGVSVIQLVRMRNTPEVDYAQK